MERSERPRWKTQAAIEQLMNDISQLEKGSALKIPLPALPDTKENIRSALSRATLLGRRTSPIKNKQVLLPRLEIE
jgi:hypothetical protein